MTETKNEPVVFLPVPAVYITAANIVGVGSNLMRVTLCEDDGYTMQPRGCFLASDATWNMIIELIQRGQRLQAEAMQKSRSDGHSAEPAPSIN